MAGFSCETIVLFNFPVLCSLDTVLYYYLHCNNNDFTIYNYIYSCTKPFISLLYYSRQQQHLHMKYMHAQHQNTVTNRSLFLLGIASMRVLYLGMVYFCKGGYILSKEDPWSDYQFLKVLPLLLLKAYHQCAGFVVRLMLGICSVGWQLRHQQGVAVVVVCSVTVMISVQEMDVLF